MVLLRSTSPRSYHAKTTFRAKPDETFQGIKSLKSVGTPGLSLALQPWAEISQRLRALLKIIDLQL